MQAWSCIDQSFIANRLLEKLPAPTQVGKTKIGGMDLNQLRMRWAIEAVIALAHHLVASQPPGWPGRFVCAATKAKWSMVPGMQPMI